MNRLHHIGASAVLFLAGTLFALLLSEAILRWVLTDRFVYQTPRFRVESVNEEDRGVDMREPLFGGGLRYVDAPWRYGLKRDLRAHLVSSEFDVVVRTNHEGLRGPEPPIPRVGPMILGLGDSFAMGFGVEENETYLAGLARDWGGNTGVTTANAGVVGYAPGNSVAYLLHDGLRQSPDLVVLQLWVVDDLCSGRRVTVPAPAGPLPPARQWRERVRSSHLAMFVRDRLRSIDVLRAWFLEHGMVAPFPAPSLLVPDFGSACAGLPELEAMLADAQAAVEAAGSHMVILLLPAREQVYPDDLRLALDYNLSRLGPEALDIEAPNRAFADLAARAGLDVVDALPHLRQVARSGGPRLYFRGYDPHLTRFGHRAVAHLLLDHLRPLPDISKTLD